MIRKKEAKEKFVGPIYGKHTLPKEYTKTKQVTNGPHLIIQQEPPAPKEIMVDKLLTDLSVFPE